MFVSMLCKFDSLGSDLELEDGSIFQKLRLHFPRIGPLIAYGSEVDGARFRDSVIADRPRIRISIVLAVRSLDRIRRIVS